MRIMIKVIAIFLDVMTIALLGKIGNLYHIQDALLAFILCNVIVLWMPMMVDREVVIFNGEVAG